MKKLFCYMMACSLSLLALSPDTKVEVIANKNVEYVDAKDQISKVILLMSTTGYEEYPVVEGKNTLGVVRATTIATEILKNPKLINQNTKESQLIEKIVTAEMNELVKNLNLQRTNFVLENNLPTAVISAYDVLSHVK